MNREKTRFWIGFDGFDSFGYNFDTKEEAEAYLDKHHTQLIRYCEHCVEIYDRGEQMDWLLWLSVAGLVWILYFGGYYERHQTFFSN